MLLLAYMSAVAILGAWSSYASKWRKVSRNKITFRSPPVGKVFLLAFGLGFLAFLPNIYAESLKPGVSWEITFLVYLLTGGVGITMLWLAGMRRELCLDTERRNYRLVRGWLWWTKTQSGVWSDFTGVFMRVVNRHHSDLFFVGLTWPGNQGQLPYLGQFDDWNKASSYASEMSKTFNVPIIAAPLVEQLKIALRP